MRNLALLLVAFLSCGLVLAQNKKPLNQTATIATTNSNGIQSALEASKYDDKYYTILNFESIPTKMEMEAIEAQNIQLLSYAGNSSYYAALPVGTTAQTLEAFHITSVSNRSSIAKISEQLSEVIAEGGEGYMEIGVVFHPKTNPSKIKETLSSLSAVTTGVAHRNTTIQTITIAKSNIEPLAANPLVTSLDLRTEQGQKLNHENRLQQRVNVLHNNVGIGRDLEGEGVCIGVGDGGDLGQHIDFNERVFSLADGTYESFGAHGDHVAGIIGSAGNLNPKHKGMAPKCDIITQKVSDITEHTASYFEDYGMVLTNNSYGVGFDCFSNGTYNYTSQTLDWQMREYDKVLHVFAAGNSGNSTCEPFPPGYKTVIRYYQSAKNVLTVGNVDENRVVANNSSRGPVADGRIKPEICGIGRSVISTGRDYNYFNSNGTSMSAPSVAGTLVLLNEQYRKLNNNEKPDGGLIKAIACNTAEDLGNPGPDYIYGFGLINGRRAVEVIEENRYFSGEIANGETQTFTIDVPQNADQLKVMLYWHDMEAESQATTTLVNDLNLSIDAGNTTYLPWILNPNPENVADNAIRGVDNVNNIEQVTISNVSAGNFELNIEGASIPVGPQKFYLVYDIVYPELVLTYPIGGESINPAEEISIHWDAEYWNRDLFSIAYSDNNGQSWETIASDIDYDRRTFSWVTPNNYNENSLIRITKSDNGQTDQTALPFRIQQSPEDFTVAAICDKYLHLEWAADPTATSYNVYMMDGEEMVRIANTTENTYLAGEGLTTGQRYWFAVQAVSPTGKESQRCVAVSAVPESGLICPWENDISLDEVVMPQRGRAATSTALGMEYVQVSLRNAGHNPVSDFPVFCSVDGNVLFQEQNMNIVEPGANSLFTFSQPVDFSTPGKYLVESWVNIEDDGHNHNDSLLNTFFVTQLPNPPVELNFSENFSATDPQSFSGQLIGPDQMEQWDFKTDENAAVAVKRFGGDDVLSIGGTANQYQNCEAILNLNLSAYTTADKILLNINYFVQHDQPNSNLYVRGADTDDWVMIAKLEKNTTWQSIADKDISELLAAAGQEYTTSFQLKFANNGGAAYLVESIGLHIDESTTYADAFEYFTAMKLGDDVELNWMTKGTTGSYYELELASGFTNFKNDDFQVIATVNWEPSNAGFQFLDEEMNKSGSRYYRIRVINPDGSTVLSPYRVVNFADFEEELVVYPNPFYNNVLLHYNNEDKNLTTLEVMLFDARGVLIKTFNEAIHLGEQEIVLEMGVDLPNGMYILRFQHEQAYQSLEVIKQGD